MKIEELLYLYPFRTESAKARDVVPEPWVVNNHHPSYSVKQVIKRAPCNNKKGFGWTGRGIEIWARDPGGDPVQGQEVSFVAAYGQGTVFDRPDLRGETDFQGYVIYVHPQRVTYWTLIVDGLWLVDKLWSNREPTYCKPAPWPPQGGRYGGWRPVELPGDGSYIIKVMRKW